MNRRKSGDFHRADRFVLDELIAQLETGSNVAENRLAALVEASLSTDTGRSGVLGDDTGEPVTEVGSSSPLDRIAASAAAGSPYSLELLIGLIVGHRLAAPAIARVVSSASIAEEIEQEVLLAVARSIHRFRGESKFTTWLFALTRNVAVSHMRKLKPTSELMADDVLGGTVLGADGPRRMSSLVTERDAVRDAVDSLPDAFRQTVLLRDIEGLSYAEIAERQGLTINTVRSRLSRGRALLAARLPS